MPNLIACNLIGDSIYVVTFWHFAITTNPTVVAVFAHDTHSLKVAWYQIVKIGNYRALLVHGDEVKSFGGNTPAFGILRKVNAWAAGVIEDFQDCYMGHWHTPMSLTMSNGGRIFVTGSPESQNEYAREFVAATGIPSQRLHFVDPDKGRVAAEYVVWLD